MWDLESEKLQVILRFRLFCERDFPSVICTLFERQEGGGGGLHVPIFRRGLVSDC